MSDNAPAPAATDSAPAPEVDGQAMPKDVANAPGNKQAAPPKPAAQKFKFGDIELDEHQARSEIERGRQSGKLLTEAQKRNEAADKKEKSLQALKLGAKKDFSKAIEALDLTHAEAVDLMSRYLYEKEIKPQRMSPAEQENARLKAELETHKQEKLSAAKAEKQKQFQSQVQEQIQKLKAELEPILNEKKIPNTRIALKRMALMMKSYQEAGVEIPAARAVDMLMADYQTEFGELLDGASPDQLEAFLGKERMNKLAKNISKWALSKLHSGSQRAPEEVQGGVKQPSKDTKKMTPGEFTKFIGGIG